MFFFSKKVKCCRYYIILPFNDMFNIADTDRFVFGIPGLILRKVDRSTFIKHFGLRYYCTSENYDLLDSNEHYVSLSKTAREDILNLIFNKSLRKEIQSAVQGVKIGRKL